MPPIWGATFSSKQLLDGWEDTLASYTSTCVLWAKDICSAFWKSPTEVAQTTLDTVVEHPHVATAALVSAMGVYLMRRNGLLHFGSPRIAIDIETGFLPTFALRVGGAHVFDQEKQINANNELTRAHNTLAGTVSELQASNNRLFLKVHGIQ